MPFRVINHSILNNKIQKKLKDLETTGYYFKFLDISTRYGNTVLVLGENKLLYPNFVTGAATSSDINTACEKALNESEAMIITWYKNDQELIDKNNVEETILHGLLWADNNQAIIELSLNRLLEEANSFKLCESRIIDEDYFVYSMPDDKVQIVRCLTKKLCEIEFGGESVSNIFIIKSRAEEEGLNYVKRDKPHFFA